MSSSYNLNELAGQDYFTFEIDGFSYKMSYPTTNELVSLNEVGKNATDYALRIENLKKEEQTDEVKEHLAQLEANYKTANQSFLDWCASYIVADREDAPDFKTHLLDKSVKYMLAFSEMVDTELNSKE